MKKYTIYIHEKYEQVLSVLRFWNIVFFCTFFHFFPPYFKAHTPLLLINPLKFYFISTFTFSFKYFPLNKYKIYSINTAENRLNLMWHVQPKLTHLFTFISRFSNVLPLFLRKLL